MPTAIRTIPVRTAPPYEVTIGSGLLGSCGTFLRPVVPACRAAVITDSTVAPLYLNTVTDSLQAAGYGVCSYVFPPGETHKNFSTLANILEFLAQQRLTRSDCVVLWAAALWVTWPVLPPASTCGGSAACKCPPPCSPP